MARQKEALVIASAVGAITYFFLSSITGSPATIFGTALVMTIPPSLYWLINKTFPKEYQEETE